MRVLFYTATATAALLASLSNAVLLADSNTDYDIDYYSQLETDAVKFSAKSELKGAAALADPAVPAQMKKAAQL